MTLIVRLTASLLVTTLACSDGTAPSDSPNGRIVYLSYRAGVSQGDLYAMNPDGSEDTRLTHDPSVEYFDLRLSPDSNRILFTKIGGSSPGGVYAVNVDGSGLAGPLALGSMYDWHPSGTELVFIAAGAAEPLTTVMVAAPDGSNPRPVTDGQGAAYDPRWSPDGLKILFVSSQPFDAPPDVYVVNRDGSGLVNLTSGDPTPHDRNATWSSDGQRIAFVRSTDAGLGLYVMNADGSGLLQLNQRLCEGAPPLWSFDGDRILCIGGSASFATAVAIVNSDGSGETFLGSPLVRQMNEPSWSPDGRSIVFWAQGEFGGDIFVADADGSDRTKLTNDPQGAYHPIWLPARP